MPAALPARSSLPWLHLRRRTTPSTFPTAAPPLPRGKPATYTISVTPQGGFAGTISFACTGLPAASSCAFNPATLTPNGSAASTTLTLSTTARSVASARPLNGTTLAALASFGFLGIVFLGGASRRKRSMRAAGMLLVLAVAVFAIASCGGGGPLRLRRRHGHSGGHIQRNGKRDLGGHNSYFNHHAGGAMIDHSSRGTAPACTLKNKKACVPKTKECRLFLSGSSSYCDCARPNRCGSNFIQSRSPLRDQRLSHL